MFYKPFQFCYCNVIITTIARKHARVYIGDNMKIMTARFGFTAQQALDIMDKYSTFARKEPAELIESYQFFKKIGFSKRDILKYPILLVGHPLKKIHHYNSLQDTGCKPIDAYLLSRSTKYLQNKIKFFKEDGYLDKDHNVVDRLLTYLDPPIAKPKALQQELNILDEMRWTEVHKIILVDWLKKRLKATDDDITKLFRIHKMIKNKSFRTISENLLLAESMGLSKEKIFKCGYLLNNYPEYPKTMLNEHPFFAGVDFAKMYKNNPKMMMVNPRRIMEIYSILKAWNISDQQIQKKPDVFSMSPVTLQDRLSHIQNTPEFRVLFSDPYMMKLVAHHIRIKSRLSFLKRLKLRCASLNFMSNVHTSRFKDYVEEGKDVNQPISIIDFLCRLLNKNRKDIRQRLTKHPYYCYVPFVDIDRTFQFLVKQGYSKENMYRCLTILLYPSDKIRRAISEMKQKESLHFDRLTQYKQLNLLLYRMEKEHHFTGNGIWRKTNSIEERVLE